MKRIEEKYISRAIEQTIQKNLPHREIIAIVGPRQSGKTTLLRHIAAQLDGVQFLDFEDRATLELFTNDIHAFAELYVNNKKYLFIDEFQYAVEGGKNLKYIFDNYSIKIFISGSSVIGLAQESLRYLVGRVFIFHLYPLSFEELLRYKDESLSNLYKKSRVHSEQVNKMLKKNYEEFVRYGGYPRVALASSSEEKEIILNNIYNTYVLKEIKGILNIKNEYKLTRLIHALALQSGNILNYNELSVLVGITYQELIENLQILQRTYVLTECRPYYRNKRTELVKAPKVFFIDTGFRNSIIKNFQSLSERPDKGALYENAIAAELLKAGYELRYWRTKSKAEVDFVIEQNAQLTPIEVKTSIAGNRIPKSLQSFIIKYKPQSAALIALETGIHKKSGNVDIITPWALSRFLMRHISKRKE